MRRVLLVIAVLLLSSAAARADHSYDALIQRMSGEIARVAHVGPPELFDISILIPFSWDHMVAFGPGTDAQAIQKALGKAGENFKAPHATIANSVVWLVFLQGDTVAAVIEYPRVYGDFSALSGHPAFEKAKAKFTVEADPRVPNWFVVKEPVIPQP